MYPTQYLTHTRSPRLKRCALVTVGLLLASACSDADLADEANNAQRTSADVRAQLARQGLPTTARANLGSYDVREGVASATLLGLMYDVRVSEAGEFEIGETPAVLPSGERAARWAYTLGKPAVRMERAEQALALRERAQLAVKSKRLTRHWGDALETFDHEQAALKHSITVMRQPEGAGRLMVSWPVLGGGQHQPEGDAQMLVRDAQGRTRMVWSGLVVKDAAGRALDARFVATGGALTISVDTAGARFPIVIDPLATNPLATDPATTLEGDQASANLGLALSNAGDVNGDGFDDLLVGQPNYTHGENIKSGRALLFLGSAAGIANTASWSLVTNTTDDRVGDALAGLGDVDGDGFSDFVIGAPQAELMGGLVNAGIVWAYKGTNQVDGGGLLTPLQVWNRVGDATERRLGQKLAAAGDVNCDGKPDLLIGAFNLSDNASIGRVEAHYGQGGSPFFLGTFATLIGQSNGFGSGLSTAGHINGVKNGATKCDSVIVGDFSFDNGGAATNNFGRFYIYTGAAAGLNVSPAVTRTGTQIGERLGRAVSGGHDINADGLDDVLVSSQLADNSGRVDAFRGNASTTLNAIPSWSATGGIANTFFGLGLALLPDVNADGRPDIAVGANNYNNGAGRVSIFFNEEFGPAPTPSWTFTGADNKARVGTSIVTAGDVNADGGPDFVVGAASSTANSLTSAGRVFVFHGVGGCVIEGVPYATGEVNPVSNCEVCDPARSATTWSVAEDGFACDDNNLCTSQDTCQAGVCGGQMVSCPASSQECRANACNPANGICEQLRLTGTTCTDNDGLSCTEGRCNNGTCYTVVIEGCAINGQCLPAGAESPTNPCRICRPEINTKMYVSAPPTKSCDDNNSCTTDDFCSNGGVCKGKALANGTMCDDHNACTVGTTCTSGVCGGGTNVCDQ
jgi:hypothetical protein